MISKSGSKFIKSLQLKKFRKETGLFIVEGAKSVLEVLQSGFSVEQLYVTSSFYSTHQHALEQWQPVIVGEQVLGSLGNLKTNNAALAVIKIPKLQMEWPARGEFVLALDEVNDPGNLGTIVRIADWFGIKKIYCSLSTTDVFAPKVVQSCMGSLTRVKALYVPIEELIQKAEMPVYGAVLHGNDVHEEAFAEPGILLMGNESAGISASLLPLVTHPITIPCFGRAESLNVAVAAAVVCDNMRRRVGRGSAL